MLGWRKRPSWSADGTSVLNHRFFWVIVEMGGAGVKRWKDLTRETGKFEELCADSYEPNSSSLQIVPVQSAISSPPAVSI